MASFNHKQIQDESICNKPLLAFAFNTYQFDDYTKYICETFNEADKAAYRDAQFPKDLENAFVLGRKLLKQED